METPTNPQNHGEKPREKRPASTPTASAVLPSGELLEMVYDPVGRKTRFVRGKGDDWRFEESASSSPTERLIPFSPTNNLVRHRVVLFATEPEEYGDDAALIERIRSFIHRYVDVSPDFETVAIYYVLFSWLYDAFEEVPYVRIRGGFGSGKTRFLLTVGSLCRFPCFASASSTVSPLFRILDAFRGTLILDEGDFRHSDEKSEIVKILNNGNAKGFPLLRTEVSSKREFDPRAYHVFGPKIIATRGFFEDRALESRCVTEDLRGGHLREDIPLNLDENFHEEARRLRNQLLLYRLRNFGIARRSGRAGASDLEPRLEQIFGPLVSLIAEADARDRVIAVIREHNRDIVDERSEGAEAQVLEIIRDLVAQPEADLSIKVITDEFLLRHSAEYERRVTARWIGSIVRRRLGLRPTRSSGNYELRPEDIAKLPALYARYRLPAMDGGREGREISPHE